ncbi:MAG: SCO family protein [Phycisphaeraceae bacterium]|nr:SCO family protein [Phycisphaeraceae bacterium]
MKPFTKITTKIMTWPRRNMMTIACGCLCLTMGSSIALGYESDAPLKADKRGRSVLSKPPVLIVDPAKDLRTLENTLSRKERSPDEIKGVTIEQKLGDTLPMDLEFTDSAGKTVTLGDYFNQGRPVILNLGYYQCPMLCGLVLNATLDVAKEMDLKIGKDYDILTLSFNPSETAILAKLKKQNYLKKLGQAGADKGWHFLVGKEQNIRKLTESVGFGYRWNEARKEYVHAAALMVITPEGQVSRYLYGVKFPHKTTRLSLVEASQGKIGNIVDTILLFCFHYDSNKGQYTLVALNLMRAGGFFSVLIVGSVVLIALYRERKRHMTEESTPVDHQG